MTGQQLQNAAKVGLAFLNAFCGIFAAYTGDDLNPLWRLFFAATVAGCGAALLILNPPNDKTQDERIADLLEERMRAAPAPHG